MFVDEHGTRCAMAYLIEQSGERSLVARIATTRNLARIRDLAGDSELVTWLDRNGLTLDEAARIQPEYGGTVAETSPSSGAGVASVIGAGVGVMGAGLNVSIGANQNARNARGLAGVVCGLVGAGLGVTGVSKQGAVRALGAIDIGVGLASFGLGIRQLDATGEKRPQAAAHAFVPAMWCDGGGMRWLGLILQF